MELAKKTKEQIALAERRPLAQNNLTLGILMVLSVGLIPINIFPRGGFQVADVFIVILIAVYLMKKSELNGDIKNHIYLLLPFIIWVIIVIIGYLLYYRQWGIIVIAINMLYAFFMLYAFSNMWRDLLSKNAYKYIYLALIVSIICVFSFKGVKEWDEMRYSFSFNNPNQLGLFALIFLAITIVLMQQKKDNNIANIYYSLLDIFFILLAHYWAFMAISRGTLAAFAILDIGLIKIMLSRNLFFPLAGAITTGAILLLLINPNFIQERIEARGTHRFGGAALEERFEHAIAEPMKDLTGFKILYGTGQIPAAQVFGQDRVKADMGARRIEVHNMFGNVLWSYGIVGLCLYTFWIAKTIWEVRVVANALWIWGALLTFSISGVLIRSRSYWLLLGLLLALWSLKKAPDQEPAPESKKPREHFPIYNKG